MTPEQITAIARELADTLYNDYRSYNSTLWWHEKPKERKAEELKYTLRFLLRRFCLVEKEVVRTTYQQAMEQGKHAHVKCQVESRAQLRLLERMFPEIAKEVEE